MGIKDDVYHIMTTTELKQWATSMGIGFKDIKQNTSFKKNLYLRIKKGNK